MIVGVFHSTENYSDPMEVVDQNKKAQASQNAKLDLCYYKILKTMSVL